MRRGFTAYIDAAFLRLPDEGGALLRGNMADVVGAAGFLSELQVPLDLAPLALAADALMSVAGSVAAVVDVAAAQEAVVQLLSCKSWRYVRQWNMH